MDRFVEKKQKINLVMRLNTKINPKRVIIVYK
jgi:hypothetical protein